MSSTSYSVDATNWATGETSGTLRYSSDVYSTCRFANRAWAFASTTEAIEWVVSRGSVGRCGERITFSIVTFSLKILQDILENSNEVCVFVILLLQAFTTLPETYITHGSCTDSTLHNKGRCFGDLYRWVIVTDNMVRHQTESSIRNGVLL